MNFKQFMEKLFSGQDDGKFIYEDGIFLVDTGWDDLERYERRFKEIEKEIKNE